MTVPVRTPPPPSGLDEFRIYVAAWLEANCPPSMRQPIVDPSERVFGGRRATFPSDDARVWLESMAAQGWTAPTWPVDCGGAALDADHAAVLAQELKRLRCRPPLVAVHGIGMVGEAILEFGTDEQRRRFLPPTAAGRIRWCQGFSEPEAGSDLANVKTRAIRDGDEYVLTGQKLWTTGADESDWIFAVVRTDPAVPKRDGLSFLLVDLTAPGVEVRPLQLISGKSEFCEVFFREVRVLCADRLGAEGEGWKVTQFVLDRERRLMGVDSGFRAGPRGFGHLLALARERIGPHDGQIADPLLRDALARADVEQECARALLRQAQRRLDPSASLHPSVTKIVTTEMMQHEADLAMRIAGTDGLGWAGDAVEADDLAVAREYLWSRAWTIGGGTTEIQLNLIARRVLGLPDLGPEQR